MESALLGLMGALLGILLNELLRRRNRIETYAARVFDKRLEVYEGLYERLMIYPEIAREVVEGDKLPYEKRHELVSAGIHEVAGWCDKHDMYLNEEVVVHCVPILMGIEEVADLEGAEEKELRMKNFRDQIMEARRLIRKECGIADIEKVFIGITKPKRSSSIIDHYRQKKKELGAKGKWE